VIKTDWWSAPSLQMPELRKRIGEAQVWADGRLQARIPGWVGERDARAMQVAPCLVALAKSLSH
jgi:hypothetical protein